MEKYINFINELWNNKDSMLKGSDSWNQSKQVILEVINLLDKGQICVSYKNEGQWKVNEWVKKAILLYFKTSEMKIYDGKCTKWYDKVDPKFSADNQQELYDSGARVVPGAYIRNGAHIGENSVIMPSFINIGARVGSGTLVDTWATIGSCAYIGRNCHISGGTGIGGVLEPLQATPVIIEDNCFIGARSEIAEGVIVGEGSVIGMGVFLGASTKIVYRNSGEVIYGKIPPYSVVVPGFMPSGSDLPGLACAVIIKQVDVKTRSKTGINELLRQN